METVTVRAVYEKGVLKPKKKLNLPEHSIVEVRVRSTRPANRKTQFASLIGVWEHLPQKQGVALEKSLARIRRRSTTKVKRLARSLR